MSGDSGHCGDNRTDRAVGQHWERQFCNLAGRYGKLFTPHQIDHPDHPASAHSWRSAGGWSELLLPDVTIWSAPGEHHEVKHKNQTRHGTYGLEVYRFDALVRFARVTGQRVYYTIHDWEIAGASSSRERVPNDIGHWFCADVGALVGSETMTRRGWSYYNSGQRQVDIRYWSAREVFRPLLIVLGAAVT